MNEWSRHSIHVETFAQPKGEEGKLLWNTHKCLYHTKSVIINLIKWLQVMQIIYVSVKPYIPHNWVHLDDWY